MKEMRDELADKTKDELLDMLVYALAKVAALEEEVERLRPSSCLMCDGGYEYINKEVTVYEGVKCHQFKNCDLRVPCDKEKHD